MRIALCVLYISCWLPHLDWRGNEGTVMDARRIALVQYSYRVSRGVHEHVGYNPACGLEARNITVLSMVVRLNLE